MNYSNTTHIITTTNTINCYDGRGCVLIVWKLESRTTLVYMTKNSGNMTNLCTYTETSFKYLNFIPLYSANLFHHVSRWQIYFHMQEK